MRADLNRSDPLNGLSFLWLEITSKCNLECSHCYADAGPWHSLSGGMNTDEWLTVIGEAADAGCRQLQFIGGEPTLHPDLPGMISFAADRGYEFLEVFTNATTLTPKLLRTFVEKKVHVATSFYSDDPATHDVITKRRGSFQRTVAGIEKLVTAGIAVRAGIIEMPENLGHAARAREFLQRLGVTDIGVDFQRGVGRGGVKECISDPMAELCGQCWKGSLCVTASGAAYPCVFSRFVQLQSPKHGLGAIIEGDALREFRMRLQEYYLNRPGVQPTCGPTCRPKCAPGDFNRCAPPPPAVEDAYRATGEMCDPTCTPKCVPYDFKNCQPKGGPKVESVRLEAASATGTMPCDPRCKPTCAPVEFPRPECVPECSPNAAAFRKM